ncbi:MAG: methylmalonyl-CoA mutase small subunit [Bacteroidetes bacterium HGW-Bacteroidetes-22]|nr:MAG: methylmalonyl-CoA mutase small subunit [Bacteroidetes bacterium HGW-Bacteroidetes-22]
MNSIGFLIDPQAVITLEDFRALLKNIPLQNTEINFTAPHQTAAIIEFFLGYIKETNVENNNIKGSVGYGPLAHLTSNGFICEKHDNSHYAFDRCCDFIKATAAFDNLRAIDIDGLSFSNAGATAVQELAFTLSQGVEYLNQLTERGLKINEITNKLRFNFGVGPNYFMEIAKIRAARLLWANIVSSFGVSTVKACRMNIHTTTSSWNSTLYDPYVNLLRTTTESMSAVTAGTDSHTILPFDNAFGKTTDFSERIARNQQLILKEESNFDKLIDPAAGSYYIENITASLAAEAWKLFMKTEEEGGFLNAFIKGYIQDQIEATAQKRDMALATRRDILLGTNQYPNFTEKMSHELSDNLLNPVNEHLPEAIARPLRIYRGSMAFEALRYRTDKFAEANHRPKAYMLTIGNFGMRKARAQFACNFFACAGFEVIDNNGFKTPADGAEAALKAKADITVICSSDDEYTTLAPEIAERLAGKSIVVIAGNPPSADELKAKGIKHFIHVKSNLLETLRAFQTEAGIV